MYSKLKFNSAEWANCKVGAAACAIHLEPLLSSELFR